MYAYRALSRLSVCAFAPFCFLCPCALASSLLLAIHAHSARGDFSAVINLPQDQPSIAGGVANTQLNVYDGGTILSERSIFDDPLNPIGEFQANGGSEINMYGGQAGRGLGLQAGAVMNVFAGEVGDVISVYEGASLNVQGGVVGNISAIGTSAVEISAGHVFGINVASFGSSLGHIEVTGGFLSKHLVINGGSSARISGGTIAADITLDVYSHPTRGPGELVLVGTEFFVNGVPLEPFAFGTPRRIPDRQVTLSGKLADGSPFELHIASSSTSPRTFADNSLLTIIRVPEPTSMLLAAWMSLVMLGKSPWRLSNERRCARRVHGRCALRGDTPTRAEIDRCRDDTGVNSFRKAGGQDSGQETYGIGANPCYIWKAFRLFFQGFRTRQRFS